MLGTTNYVRHLYVANASSGTNPGSVVGVITNPEKSMFAIKFYDALGALRVSDYIPIAGIEKITLKPALPQLLRKDYISMEAPIAGQDYILRVTFIGSWMGSQHQRYTKHIGAYRAKTGDTAETVFTAIRDLAVKNFARDSSGKLTFAVQGTGANAKLVVTETQQGWTLGKKQGRPLEYSLEIVPITKDNQDYIGWATITKETASHPGLGTPRLAADMEWFYMGERGDQYRGMGYPDNFDTKYLAENAEYDILDIKYFTTSAGTASTKEQKELVILCKKASSGTVHAIANAIAGFINAVQANLVSTLDNVTMIAKGSLGTVGNATITGLTSGKVYNVISNYGQPNEATSGVAANGTLGTAAALTGTAITGLTNGVLYKVVEVA